MKYEDEDEELTLLAEEEIWEGYGGKQLDVLKQYGNIAAITDLAVLTGGYCEDRCSHMAPDDNTLKGRTSWFYTKSSDGDGDIRGVNDNSSRIYMARYKRNGTIRPVLLSPSLFDTISLNAVSGYNGTEEVEYGEYPQYAPDSDMQNKLENEYQNNKKQKTGNDYTFDSTKYDEYTQRFQPVTYEEYEYGGKKYIRIKANSDYGDNRFKLSNDEQYVNGNYVWVEVSPVVWLIDQIIRNKIS